MRVLVIAEAANPEWASVPLIGWEVTQALRTVADVHLVTQVRNRDAILRHGLVEGVEFTAIDSEAIARRLHAIGQKIRGGEGKGWTTVSALSSLSYYFFEDLVWKHFESRLRSKEFDLVHRVTPLSPTNHSIIAKRLARIGIPFVLGPLNGGLPWPPGFNHRRHAEREWLSYVRGIYKLMPAYTSTLKYSSAIITGSRATAQEMPRWVEKKSVYIPENGINRNRFSTSRSYGDKGILRGAFVGRLVPYKGADILITAAAPLMRAGKLILDIIGDGPQRAELLEIVKREGVGSSVSFHGWIPHAEVQGRLRNCSFLALPSIREFGGGVVLEAMALGVVPIVADYGGPAELVDHNKTGFKVPFTNEATLTSGLASVLQSIVASPDNLVSVGVSARNKVFDEFTWEAKARQIERVYREVIKIKTNEVPRSLDAENG